MKVISVALVAVLALTWSVMSVSGESEIDASGYPTASFLEEGAVSSTSSLEEVVEKLKATAFGRQLAAQIVQTVNTTQLGTVRNFTAVKDFVTRLYDHLYAEQVQANESVIQEVHACSLNILSTNATYNLKKAEFDLADSSLRNATNATVVLPKEIARHDARVAWANSRLRNVGFRTNQTRKLRALQARAYRQKLALASNILSALNGIRAILDSYPAPAFQGQPTFVSNSTNPAQVPLTIPNPALDPPVVQTPPPVSFGPSVVPSTPVKSSFVEESAELDSGVFTELKELPTGMEDGHLASLIEAANSLVKSLNKATPTDGSQNAINLLRLVNLIQQDMLSYITRLNQKEADEVELYAQLTTELIAEARVFDAIRVHHTGLRTMLNEELQAALLQRRRDSEEIAVVKPEVDSLLNQLRTFNNSCVHRARMATALAERRNEQMRTLLAILTVLEVNNTDIARAAESAGVPTANMSIPGIPVTYPTLGLPPMSPNMTCMDILKELRLRNQPVVTRDYNLIDSNNRTFGAFCEMDIDGGGWMLAFKQTNFSSGHVAYTDSLKGDPLLMSKNFTGTTAGSLLEYGKPRQFLFLSSTRTNWFITESLPSYQFWNAPRTPRHCLYAPFSRSTSIKVNIGWDYSASQIWPDTAIELMQDSYATISAVTIGRAVEEQKSPQCRAPHCHPERHGRYNGQCQNDARGEGSWMIFTRE